MTGFFDLRAELSSRVFPLHLPLNSLSQPLVVGRPGGITGSLPPVEGSGATHGFSSLGLQPVLRSNRGLDLGVISNQTNPAMSYMAKLSTSLGHVNTESPGSIMGAWLTHLIPDCATKETAWMA